MSTSKIGETEGVWVEHPLFPAEGEESPPPISFINVFRYEASGPCQIMRTFRAEELQSEEQIAQLYGGGLYELHGRRASKADATLPGNKVRQRRFRIPGAPLALAPGQATLPAEGEKKVATTEEPTGGIMGLFLQMQMQMMTMQEAAAARREEAAQREADRREEATRRAAEQQRSEAARSNEMMIQMMNQSQNTLVTVLVPLLTKGSGGGTEELTKMVDVLKGLGMKLPGTGDDGGGGKETDVGQVVADIADTVQGVAAIMTASKGAAAALPKGPAGEGSAASLLKPGGQ